MRQPFHTANVAILALLLALAGGGLLQAQVVFDLGSTGADGPLVVSANTTLQLPPDGIFNFTTIDVQAGKTLQFTRNALNTPVYLLATGDVTIAGTIRVNGSSPTLFDRGAGGPGGFDGGAPGFSGGVEPGAGHGPGGGLPDPASSGGGSYGGFGGQGSGGKAGLLYGNPTLIPLVGGSGGGGVNGFGGGGGGGAILVGSNTSLVFTGRIEANGSSRGSGGGIRLVAPKVSGAGGNLLAASSFSGGLGRIRVDAIHRSGMSFGVSGLFSAGSFVKVFPDTPLPRLDLVEVAGQLIAEGTPQPVVLELPVGTPATQTLTVQGRDFTGLVSVDIVLVPDSGDPITVPVQLDFSTANPVQATVTVDFPVNNRTSVFAWVR